MTVHPGAATVAVAGERLVLLPERAAFWPAGGTLLLADPHFGKAATLRAAGLPIPGGTTTADLDRLSVALGATGARRLVVLGDLFHARAGRRAARTLAALARWRDRHATLDALVVRGNHDRHAGDAPAELGFEAVEAPFVLGPFVLHHEPPAEATAAYALAGHVHPAVMLTEGGRRGALRLPCFWFGPRVGVLPAFGSTTGLATVRPAPGDAVFVVADGEVVGV